MANPVVNPKKISWTDPTTAKDASGKDVAWDASDRAGIQIEFDGQAAVSVPLTAGVAQIDPRTVAAFQSLPAGAHTFTLAIVTKEGIVGSESADQPFLVAVVPSAPTAIAVA